MTYFMHDSVSENWLHENEVAVKSYDLRRTGTVEKNTPINNR